MQKITSHLSYNMIRKTIDLHVKLVTSKQGILPCNIQVIHACLNHKNNVTLIPCKTTSPMRKKKQHDHQPKKKYSINGQWQKKWLQYGLTTLENKMNHTREHQGTTRKLSSCLTMATHTLFFQMLTLFSPFLNSRHSLFSNGK